MPYGLVSSPVVGFDLVRHAHGPRVALVLRYAVGAGAEHVRALAAAWEASGGRPGDADALVRHHAERSPGEDASALVRVALQAGDPRAARSLLTGSPVGGLADVLALVRDRVVPQCWARPTLLHPPGAGADLLDDDERAVAADAVAAALVRAWSTGDPGAPFDAATTAAPAVPAVPAVLGGAADGVRGALTALAAASPAQVDALRRAAADDDEPRPPGSWARAVHEVSVALEAAGRTEAAACAQLEAVGAARLAGLDARDAAAGAWQVVSGALHALCAAGLGVPVRPLLAPWERALGRGPVPRPRGAGGAGA